MSKSKLTPLGRSLLLKHSFGHYFQYVGNAPSKFFKFLLISNSFLSISQRERVYRLVFKNYNQACKKFKVYLNQADAPFNDYCQARHFYLKPYKLHKLHCLLNLQYIEFGDYLLNEDEFQVFLSDFEGKISLHFQRELLPNVINEFAGRLYQLQCRYGSLTDLQSISYLNLDVLKTYHFAGFGQLKAVLSNHRIKNLEVYCYSRTFEESVDDKFFDDFPICPRIVGFEFDASTCETVDMIANTVQSLRFMPNLRKFKWKFGYRQRGFRCTPKTFSRLILSVHSYIQQMNTLCPSATINLEADFSLVLRNERQVPFETIHHELEKTGRFDDQKIDKNITDINDDWNESTLDYKWENEKTKSKYEFKIRVRSNAHIINELWSDENQADLVDW